MDTLFFIASKLVGFALRVETWLLLLALLTMWAVQRAWMPAAKRLSGLLVGLVLVIGLVPLGDMLLRPIERQVPSREALVSVDGIVILGGGEDLPASLAAGQPQLGEGGDRYLAAVSLARQFPEATLLFAGGSGRLRDAGGAPVSEAAIAEQVFLQAGIASERMLFESRSRNTAENAQLSRALVAAKPEDTWVLVTSAFHMPRALRSFEAAGWEQIVPYPVDYRTRNWNDRLGWQFARNLGMLNMALREWVGRLAYAVTGR